MTRIASWNSARDVWETEAVSLLSGRLDVYSETFPTSGSMRNGVAYRLPASAHHIADSGSLFSQLGGKLIPTPRASDGAHGGPNQRGSKGDLTVSSAMALLRTPMGAEADGGPSSGVGPRARIRLSDQVAGVLLPSPVAQPSGNTPEDHLCKKPGRAVVTDLAIIVENGPLETGGRLLPTPEAKLATSSPDYERATRRGSGGHDLATATHLLPTPKAGDADFGMPRTSGRPPEKSTHLMTRMEFTKPAETWGPYAAAIERWELALGRPAPEPTELGPKGGRRLSAAFVEWMMGLPAGWVTGRGLSRTAELKMLGNGVVPQQAVAALTLML